jgi:hypothetical protein
MQKTEASLPRIVTLEELSQIPDLENQVAGSTSVSFSHVLKGFLKGKRNLLGYKGPKEAGLHINLILSREVIEDLVPLTDPKVYHQSSGWDWMSDNRHHGFYWAIEEVLTENKIKKSN